MEMTKLLRDKNDNIKEVKYFWHILYIFAQLHSHKHTKTEHLWLIIYK